MPRFVLLYHECPSGSGTPSHWDFMLERDGALVTWRLMELPLGWQPGAKLATTSISSSVIATRLADHRIAYLNYEGSLSDDRGNVTRMDGGEFSIVQDDDARLRVHLCGEQIRGSIVLARSDGDAWRLQVAENG